VDNKVSVRFGIWMLRRFDEHVQKRCIRILRHALFTRTVEEAPGINTIRHPLHIARLTVGSLLSMSSTKSNAKCMCSHLDIRFLPDDFHRVYVAPRKICSGYDPLWPFFWWILRDIRLASTERNLRGGASGHAIEKNTGLVEEVETLDDITIPNSAWVGNIVFVLFAHLNLIVGPRWLEWWN